MNRRPNRIAGLLLALGLSGSAQEPAQEPALEKAAHHPMQYYLSLPDDWKPGGSWPVVIALEGGNKNFLRMARTFVEARGALPFIIVSPIILTNGGGELRSLPEYHYPAAVWDEVDRSGKCKFDFDGLAAIVEELHDRYGGERKVFITGHSAGAHLAWATILQHPEKLAAGAVTCGNYNGRCMTAESFDALQGRDLPVRGYQGAFDRARQPLELQFQRGRDEAARRGYRNVSFEIVEGAGHDPFAKQVLAYFDSLRNR